MSKYKKYKCFLGKCKFFEIKLAATEKETIWLAKQIYYSRFTIWLKITKIKYSDSISKVFDHESFGL